MSVQEWRSVLMENSRDDLTLTLFREYALRG